jgi:GPH family glycoside/pentoside/hexuronide:cation symporter
MLTSLRQNNLTTGERSPRYILIGWGLGTIGPSLVLSATSLLLLRYLTDFIGLAAGLAAGLIAFAKLYDALTDPLIGALSDRTGGAAGRRRPWLLFGGLALAISLPLLFNIPRSLGPSGATLWAGAALLFYSNAYACFVIPYVAMSTEITQNFDDRSYMMSWRVAASGLGSLAAALLGANVIDRLGGGLRGHQIMSFLLAPIVVAFTLLAYWSTRAAPVILRSPKSSVGFAKQVRLALANKPFVLFLGVKMLMLMMLGIGAAYAYFFTLILHRPISLLGAFVSGSTVFMIISQPLWLYLAKRWGKKETLQFALTIVVLTSLSWLLVGRDEPMAGVLVRGCLSGLANGGTLCASQAMLPDVLEYDRVKSGIRREGLFAGLYTIIEKLASALGIALIGIFLQAMGYISHRSGGGVTVQPDSALLAIRLCVSVVPAVLCGGCVLLLCWYNLKPETIERLRAAEVFDNAKLAEA